MCRGACGKNWFQEPGVTTGNWRIASPGKSYDPAFFYFKILISQRLICKISLYLLTFYCELRNRHISYPSRSAAEVFGVHLSAWAAFRLARKVALNPQLHIVPSIGSYYKFDNVKYNCKRNETEFGTYHNCS